MGHFVASTRTIASVYPMLSMPIERPFGPTNRGGTTTYRIDACPKGAAPTLLVVADAWQATKDPISRETGHPDLIFAEQIAADLLKHWTGPKLLGAPPGVGPGIWLCVADDPVDEEVKAALVRQTGYFEWLFYDGQKLFQNQDWGKITEEHRVGALWLGKEEPWCKNLLHEDIRHCPACRAVVDPLAYLCKTCGFPVKEMPADMLAAFQGLQGQTPGRSQRTK